MATAVILPNRNPQLYRKLKIVLGDGRWTMDGYVVITVDRPSPSRHFMVAGRYYGG